MRKTLSLVMIVKNEEKGLEKAILSARSFVQDIFICVDSDSNDKTYEIAKKFTSNVEYYHFANDFSKARNWAHRNVKTDWIIFLDGHEFVEKAEKLEEYLNSDADGLLCTIKMENGTEFRNPRIYKNGVQFEGAVHERLQCLKPALCSGVVVKHNRIEGQSTSSTAERDEQRDFQMSSIMAEMAKENPKDLRVLFHMALWAQTKGNYRLALKYQNKYLKLSPARSDRYFVLYNRSMLFYERGKLFRAFWAISRAGWEEPNRWETEKMKGIIYFTRGKLEKALTCLVNSLAQNTQDFAYKPLKRDDAGTWNLIGECFYKRGIFDKASTAFGLASERAEKKDQKDFFKQRQQLMVNMLIGRKN